MAQTIEVRNLRTGELAPRVTVGVFSAAPEYRLFTAQSVAIATLFGTPAAGTALMAANYMRLGKPGRAAGVMASGLAVTTAAIGVGYASARIADSLMALVLIVLMRLTAEGLQGESMERHLRQGGRAASRWIALGIGMLFLAGIWGVVMMLARVQAI